MEERFSVLLNRTCLVGCLLGVCGTWYFLFGLAGYVSNPWLNFSVVIVILAAALFFICHFLAIPRQTNWLGKTIWAAIFVILIVEIVLGLLPPTSRDELTHHLAIPRLYANAGSVPKWIHALVGFLTGLLLYAYLGGRMNAVYGLLGFFFFVSTPVIARLSHWGYIDLGITFYTTASLLCLLRWREERQALRWLGMAALSLGFVLATKPNGLVAGLLISLLFLMVIVKPPRKSLIEMGYELVLFGGLVLLPFLPWILKNWFQTGNPFYPLLGNLFPSSTGPAAEGVSFAGLGIFEKRALLYGENFWQILSLPLRVFVSGQDDNPRLFDGVLTPILIIFLPWSFKGKWLDEKKFVATFSLLFFLYALFLVDMRIRYILLIVPFLVILATYGIFNVYLRIKRPIYLIAGLFFFAVWHGVYLWEYFSAAAPLSYLSGNESRNSYLTRMLPEYTSFQYVNRATATTAKIYLLFIGRRAYYCERDYFHDGGDLPGYLLGAVRAAENADQIAQALKRKEITHLVVREDLLARFLINNLSRNQSTLWNEFAMNRLRLLFRDGRHAVYQLDG